jgi:hypothetical protein
LENVCKKFQFSRKLDQENYKISAKLFQTLKNIILLYENVRKVTLICRQDVVDQEIPGVVEIV